MTPLPLVTSPSWQRQDVIIYLARNDGAKMLSRPGDETHWDETTFPPCKLWVQNCLRWGEIYFSHIHRVIHTICPEWPACHPQGGGWQATRPVSRVKWLWRNRQTRRNVNVARPDSPNFPTFTSEKYLFGTYRRKIINIFCPLVTEKSTNPRVKLTCPCLGKPRHGLS